MCVPAKGREDVFVSSAEEMRRRVRRQGGLAEGGNGREEPGTHTSDQSQNRATRGSSRQIRGLTTNGTSMSKQEGKRESVQRDEAGSETEETGPRESGEVVVGEASSSTGPAPSRPLSCSGQRQSFSTQRPR